MPNLLGVKKDIERRLLAAGIDEREVRHEAVLILEHVTGYSLAQQHLQAEQLLLAEQLIAVDEIVTAREQRQPLQYCLGYAWFAGRQFSVGAGVLIPRPETEILVEVALRALAKVERPLIADIGCGSGAIAISILKERPDARAFAVDISVTAVQTTARNAERHGVASRLSLQQGDWLAFPPPEPVHALVSNPPYIPRRLAAELEPEVAVFEPELALFDADENGLGFYRSLSAQSGRFLLPQAFLALEVGQGQADMVMEILRADSWQNLGVDCDLNGIKRVVSAFRADRSS